MKIQVDYEYTDPLLHVFESDTAEIKIDKPFILNENTTLSIKRYIQGLIGLRKGFVVMCGVTIKNIKISC